MNHAIHQTHRPLNLDAGTEQRDAQPGSQPIEASLPCAISSEALLRGQPLVRIVHQGTIYRLQTTRQGKLILTK